MNTIAVNPQYSTQPPPLAASSEAAPSSFASLLEPESSAGAADTASTYPAAAPAAATLKLGASPEGRVQSAAPQDPDAAAAASSAPAAEVAADAAAPPAILLTLRRLLSEAAPAAPAAAQAPATPADAQAAAAAAAPADAADAQAAEGTDTAKPSPAAATPTAAAAAPQGQSTGLTSALASRQPALPKNTGALPAQAGPLSPQAARAAGKADAPDAPPGETAAAPTAESGDGADSKADTEMETALPAAAADALAGNGPPAAADGASAAMALVGLPPANSGALAAPVASGETKVSSPGQLPRPVLRPAGGDQPLAAGRKSGQTGLSEADAPDQGPDASPDALGLTQASGLTVQPAEAAVEKAAPMPGALERSELATASLPTDKTPELPAATPGDIAAPGLLQGFAHGAHGAAATSGSDAASSGAAALSTPLSADADLPEALGERVLLLSEAGMSSARIELHPAELGSLVVRIELHQDQAQVSFSADNPATRSLLQQAMPQLRELFGAQGLQLLRTRVEERQREAGSSSGGFAQSRARAEPASQRRIARIRLVDAYV